MILPHIPHIPLDHFGKQEKSAPKVEQPAVQVPQHTVQRGLAPVGLPSMLPVAAFEQAAGIQPPPPQGMHHSSLRAGLERHIQQAAGARTLPAARARTAGATDQAKGPAKELRLEEAVDKVLSILKRPREQKAESDLEGQYDPLERYQIFKEAADRLKREDMAPNLKQQVQERLKAMSDALYKKFGKDIEAARPAISMAKVIVDKLGLSQLSGDELRNKLGTPGKPFDAKELATKLRVTFGEQRFVESVSTVSSSMLNVLRSSTAGPPLLLALKEAQSIRQIMECIALAKDFRAELGKVQAPPLMSVADMAIQIMSIPTVGRGRIGGLVTEMVQLGNLSPARRGRCLQAIYKMVAALPLSMWPVGQNGRNDILGEIRAQINGAFESLPSQPTKEQQREAELREQAQTMRSPRH